jgi:tetratricopeptide (TPR) repeat protein
MKDRDQGERLAAASQQYGEAAAGGTLIQVQHGDVHVYQWKPAYRVQAFAGSAAPLPRGVLAQPSRLLAARHQVVAFTGRAEDIADLEGWRDDDSHRRRARLLHGPGGQGKTRLAGRFAELSAQAGWLVLEARSGQDLPPPPSLVPPSPQARVPDGIAGVLVVVDYAERWQIEALAELTRDEILGAGPAARLLLVARPAGSWWQSVAHRAGKAGAVCDQRWAGPLADDERSRVAAFGSATNQFAKVLGVADPETIPPPDLIGDEAFGHALTLHMAALAAVDARVRGTVPPPDPSHLSSYLLGRENDFWHALHSDGISRFPTTPRAMARAVVTATLTGPLSYDAASSVVRRLGVVEDGGTDSLLHDHTLCYPPAGPGTVLEPLLPDRLGEDFLGLTLPGHTTQHYLPDPVVAAWAGTAPAHMLASGEAPDTPPGYAGRAVTVLIETAHRWPHIARDYLYPLLREHPRLALAAGGAAVVRLTSLPGVDIAVLEAIEAVLPPPHHADFALAAAAVVRQLTEHRLAETTDPWSVAALNLKLGERLRTAGLLREALEVTERACEIVRQLADADPMTYAFELADALTDLAAIRSDLGQNEEAVACSTQAVAMHRLVVRMAPGLGENHLSRALTNLGNQLWALGRHEAAIAATTEAVQIRRRLLGTDPAFEQRRLAYSLTNLGTLLVEAGRPADAAPVAGEAVAMYQPLAEADPGAHERDFARALHNLGRALAETGRLGEALTVTRQAVAIRRRLADTNPHGHESGLAKSLSNLAAWLIQTDQYSEALPVAEEAVELLRRQVAAVPGAHEPALVSALVNLAGAYRGTGEYQRALGPARESAELASRLAEGTAQSGKLRALAELALRQALQDASDGTHTEEMGADDLTSFLRLLYPFPASPARLPAGAADGAPLVLPGLVMATAVYRGSQVDFLFPSSMPELGGGDLIRSLATANLRSLAPPRVRADQVPGQPADCVIHCLWTTDPFAAARMCDIDSLLRAIPDARQASHGLLLAVPAYNGGYLHIPRNRSALSALTAMAGMAKAYYDSVEETVKVSPDVFFITPDGRIQQVTHPEKDGGVVIGVTGLIADALNDLDA